MIIKGKPPVFEQKRGNENTLKRLQNQSFLLLVLSGETREKTVSFTFLPPPEQKPLECGF